MKKVFIIVIIFIAFILGLKMTDIGISSSQLLEKDKIQFEEDITKPGNEYQPKNYQPEENIVNKTANKIENTIDKIIEKVKDIIKKL